MSPASRGRKKKPGQAARSRRGRRSASPYALILADAQRLLDEKSTLVAEQWAAHLLGLLWVAAWTGEQDDPQEVLETRIEALVEHMVADGGPAALRALRALAMVGEEWTRELASEAGDVLCACGVPEPVWRCGEEVRLAAAYALRDLFGEVEVVVLGFDRDGQRHVVLVVIAHVAGSRIGRIRVGEVDAGGVEGMVEALRAQTPFFGEAVALTGAQARARLEEPLEGLLCDGPQKGGPADEMFHGVDGDAAFGWGLLRARLDTLPDDLLTDDDLDELDDVEQTVTAFLASAYVEGLPDRQLAQLWARMAGDWAVDSTGVAHRHGPFSLIVLLTGEVSRHVAIEDADLALLPEVIRAWAHFTVEAGGLAPQAHQLWDEHLPTVLSGFAAAYAEVESVTHRATCPQAYDLRAYGTPAAAHGLLE
jgi:hypothetical protein